MAAKKIAPWIALSALGFAAVASAQQTLYRWVDKDGKLQYSDIQPNTDAKVTEKALKGGGPDTTALPYATQMAVRSNPVTLFAGRDCQDGCDKARKLLQGRGVPYEERDAQADKITADLLTAKVGELYIPSLLVGQTAVKGFQEGPWNSALDAAGYPRTLLPGQIAPKAPEAVKKGSEQPAQAAAGDIPQNVELVTERR